MIVYIGATISCVAIGCFLGQIAGIMTVWAFDKWLGKKQMSSLDKVLGLK